ncbi:MAG: tRNA lysidine(34) synthetase TilS [Thermodesulfobacteriota bacterium]
MPVREKHSKRSDLSARFKAALLDLTGPDPGNLVVAFSGGADSTALLHLLAGLRDELGYALQAAHLNHGLRDQAGDQDRLAAEAVSRKLDIPFHWDLIDCRNLAKKRSLSVEEASREARYEFLEKIRRRTGAAFIAIGHTADDNTELVLMNLMRGAGPSGLAGMPVRRGFIIRPLLNFRRKELIVYLEDRGLSWVDDASNRDLNFTRNRIRHDLLPKLRADYNPDVDSALWRTARIFRDEEAVWSRLVSEAAGRAGWKEEAGWVGLDRTVLAQLDRAVARRLIRAAVEKIIGPRRGLGFGRVEEVLDLARAPGKSGFDLPGGPRVWTESGRLLLGRPVEIAPARFEQELCVPGETRLRAIAGRLTARIESWPQNIDLKSLGPFAVVLDYERLTPPFLIRSFRPGDKFQPLGLAGTKKLSDLFIDAKVPAGHRHKIPLVVDAQGLVWVAGFRPAERARIHARTSRALFLTLEAGN